jgi:heavy metal efflux system protein
MLLPVDYREHITTALGFVPMAFATGTGAEVQRTVATVVIGGILSPTAWTLGLLAVPYRLFYRGVQYSGLRERGT